MSFGLRILPAADADVDELAADLARDSVEQALRLYDAVEATYTLILGAPQRWPLYGFLNPLLGDLRKRSVEGFASYLVFYRVDADMIEIVRVLHGARDMPAVLVAGVRPFPP